MLMKVPSLNLQILLAAVLGLMVGLLFQSLGVDQPSVQTYSMLQV